MRLEQMQTYTFDLTVEWKTSIGFVERPLKGPEFVNAVADLP